MISINLSTRQETVEWPVGRSLLTALVDAGEEMIPDRYEHDFLPKVHEFTSIADCRAEWVRKINVRIVPKFGGPDELPPASETILSLGLSRKKQLKYQWRIKHTGRSIHGELIQGWLAADFSNSKKVDWWRLFRRWSRTMQPVLGFVHLEMDRPEENISTSATPLTFPSIGGLSNPELLQFYWGMVFGAEHAENFPTRALRRDGFHVERLKNCVLLRLTDDIWDVKKDYPAYLERRELAKSHFPKGFTQF